MIENLILLVANWISYTGVAIVVIGVLVTLIQLLLYFVKGLDEWEAARLRHSLMIYLSLGLDFLIAKDVILTLSLEQGDIESFVTLGLVIAIRMLISLFVHFEDKELSRIQARRSAKKKSK